MLEKYLNLEGFLEMSFKIKSVLKSTGKLLRSLEKSLNSTIFSLGLSTVDRGLNQYKIVVPLFGAAFYTNFPVLMSPLSQSTISGVEF